MFFLNGWTIKFVNFGLFDIFEAVTGNSLCLCVSMCLCVCWCLSVHVDSNVCACCGQ